MKRVRGTDMVSKTEAAKILGVSLKTLYNMEADGRIEAKTFEGRPAYLVNDLYRNMPAVIGVINQKGGAGKTTLSICLADFFSSLGKRVLCVDLDPQAALSINLLPEEEVVEGKTLADHFNDPNNYRLERIVRKTVYQNIEVLPTVYAMAKHEHTQDREMLEYAKNWKKFLGNYDIVILDGPPHLSAFTSFAIMLADLIILPAVEELMCFRQTVKTASIIHDICTFMFAGEIKPYRIVTSAKPSKRTNVNKVNRERYEAEFGERVMDKILPDYVGFQERIELDPQLVELNFFTATRYDKEKIQYTRELMEEIERELFDHRETKIGDQ